MFIDTKYSGYNRHGEQSAAGRFLILMQPHYSSIKYPQHSELCGTCGKVRQQHETPLPAEVQEISDKLHRAWKYLFTERTVQDSEDLRDAVEIILDAKRRVEGCRYFCAASIDYPIRAIVRYVRMTQFGHFMMGSARVGAERIGLSGSYGHDGLPTMVPDSAYEQGIPLPAELYEAWKNGGGWNGAGSEAQQMRQWALKAFPRK